MEERRKKEEMGKGREGEEQPGPRVVPGHHQCACPCTLSPHSALGEALQSRPPSTSVFMTSVCLYGAPKGASPVQPASPLCRAFFPLQTDCGTDDRIVSPISI